MRKPEPTRADDERLLTMLDLREAEGMTAIKIGETLGMTKGAVLGATRRIFLTVSPCLCAKPENQDGAMGRRWWK